MRFITLQDLPEHNLPMYVMVVMVDTTVPLVTIVTMVTVTIITITQATAATATHVEATAIQGFDGQVTAGCTTFTKHTDMDTAPCLNVVTTCDGGGIAEGILQDAHGLSHWPKLDSLQEVKNITSMGMMNSVGTLGTLPQPALKIPMQLGVRQRRRPRLS